MVTSNSHQLMLINTSHVCVYETTPRGKTLKEHKQDGRKIEKWKLLRELIQNLRLTKLTKLTQQM